MYYLLSEGRHVGFILCLVSSTDFTFYIKIFYIKNTVKEYCKLKKTSKYFLIRVTFLLTL